MNHCGYYGCHVRNLGECECTKCGMNTGGCLNCESFPNKARSDFHLHNAMLTKCEECKDILAAERALEFKEIKDKLKRGAYGSMGEPEGFRDDCIYAIMKKAQISRNQALRIYEKANKQIAKGSIDGYLSVLNQVEKLCDFVWEILYM